MLTRLVLLTTLVLSVVSAFAVADACGDVCAGDTPHCLEDSAGASCVECLDNSHCSVAGETCNDNVCGVEEPPADACDPACAEDQHCLEDSVGASCVECLDNSHCSTAGETCINNACGVEAPECNADDECDAGAACIKQQCTFVLRDIENVLTDGATSTLVKISNIAKILLGYFS